MALAKILTRAGDALIFVPAYCVALLCRCFHCYSHIWLICERPDQARDNGFHLFRYTRTHYPLCNVYYVIRRGAIDLDAIESLGHIVFYKSFRHYLLHILADKLIYSHKSGLILQTPSYRRAIEYIFPKHTYNLTHGIVKEYLHWHTHETSAVDLVVCGAKPEYDYISTTVGFPHGVVQYLGLCRFDALHDVAINRKQILLMPTWRMWFGMANDRNHATCLEILQSDYFVTYNNLINDPRLIQMVHAHDMNMVFFLHHQMQEFAGKFSSTSEHVIIAHESEYREQQLLMESALLITDYSSVAFDFAYMQKPLIYYQFDEERYYAEHYARSYFDYGRDGFGPVVHTQDDLIEQIRTAIETEFAEPSCYMERSQRFFPIRDTNNCQRNYEAILSRHEVASNGSRHNP